jgi:hypothetical protein
MPWVANILVRPLLPRRCDELADIAPVMGQHVPVIAPAGFCEFVLTQIKPQVHF